MGSRFEQVQVVVRLYSDSIYFSYVNLQSINKNCLKIKPLLLCLSFAPVYRQSKQLVNGKYCVFLEIDFSPERLKHGVSLWSYHMVMRQFFFGPIWSEFLLATTSRDRPLRLDLSNGRLQEVRVYHKFHPITAWIVESMGWKKYIINTKITTLIKCMGFHSPQNYNRYICAWLEIRDRWRPWYWSWKFYWNFNKFSDFVYSWSSVRP